MNKLRLIALVLVLCIAAGCTSKKEAAEKFFQSGLSFYNENQMEKARVEFLNAMQKDPQRADTYYYLGLIAKKEGDFPLVLENMNIAMLLDETNLDAKSNVAELFVFNKEFERANELADEMLVIDPNYHHALRIKAAVKVGEAQYDQAKVLLSQALAIEPNDAALYALNAVVEEKLGNYSAAVEHLSKAIATSDDKVQYLLFRSNMHRKLGNYQALEQDLRTLMDEKPKEERFIRSLAELLLEQGQEKKAMLMLRKFIRNNPEKTGTTLFYIGVLENKDKDKAMVELSAMIKNQPTLAALRFYRIKHLMKTGEEDEAISELQEINAGENFSENQRLDAGAMLADFYMGKGQKSEALGLIKTNLSVNPQHEKTLLLDAQNMIADKHYEHAVSNLRAVLRKNPSSEKALILLGHVYTQSGSDLLADDSYRQALNLNPSNLNAAMPVVEKLLESQDLERSDKVITAALARRPDDQRLLIFLAQIKILKKEWSSVERLAKRLKERGNLAYSLLLRGRVQQGLKAFQSAADLYLQTLEADPMLIPALQGLSASYLALSKKAELLAYLNDYQETHADTIVALMISAEVYKQSGEQQASVKQLEKALKIRPSWVKGYAMLAGQRIEIGDSSGAVATYRRGIADNNNDLSLRVLLATYYESIDEIENAATLYKRIIEEDPEHLLAINNYTSLLLDKFATEESYQEALALIEPLKASSEPYFMDTVGWALVKNKRYSEGERYLRLASENAGSVADIKYHLGVALKYLERKEEAKKWLGRASVLASEDSDLSRAIEYELNNI